MPKTLTFSEKSKGWTSFFSFIPDAMCKLNNRFFTIKEGQLYLHNDKDNPVVNNFYGEQFSSKIKTVINDSPSDDKIFKNLVLEGNKSWEATIKTNLTESTIKKEEFNQKESRFFAYLRKNENEEDLTGDSAQGIGVISRSTGLNIVFGYVPDSVSVGDVLYQVNGSNNEVIGVINNINVNTITVDSIITSPVSGYYCFSKKDSRIEGSEVRGYYMEVELENNDTDGAELFAISSNAVKSHV